ncbi:hypothetical protein CAPTEDRAFT_191264 [Capitella teleta]|uniref:G-protein coupled receptors family 1 profile domain-containing protein n=1 Tax=Capitella teleta TaxID=283909 RepID=R7UDH2_CAPTE|nr:hypothetical protein CAPTEDRAFT_191264 [Capitella teleta]|eukprot:ELU01843.1 hypothetical protein CAPTEDRAFT_191264 [Capitella teleta]
MTTEVTALSDQQSSPSHVEPLAFSNVLMTSGLVGTFTSTIVLLPFRLVLVIAIILGNVTTVLAIFKNHRLQTNTNWILCSLAVADTLNGIALFGFVQRRKIQAMEVQMSSPQQNSDKERDAKQRKNEYKATVLTLVVSVIAIVLWSPYLITVSCLYLGFTTPLAFTVLQMSVGLGMCNSAVNFFLYALMNNELRLAFAKIWGIKILPRNGQV